MRTRLPLAALLLSGLGCATAGPVSPAHTAQAKLLAVADAALAAVSRGDWAGLSELMLPEGTLWNTRDKAGAPAWSVLTRAQVRETQSKEVFTERGFAGEARVSGHLASVWLPYDFYRDGKWSHCGIDSLTLVETPEGWRIAQFSYTVEQPPACAKHPAGPPLGAK